MPAALSSSLSQILAMFSIESINVLLKRQRSFTTKHFKILSDLNQAVASHLGVEDGPVVFRPTGLTPVCEVPLGSSPTKS